MMIHYTTSKTLVDLKGILTLQRSNLAGVLQPDEIASQGFVTVSHTLDELKDLNDIEKHVIAKDNERVIAYLLAMTARSSATIPILIPMFDEFRNVRYRGKFVPDYNYVVVGQACVDRQYRGKGVFDNCYVAYQKAFVDRYDFAITEIATLNARSLRAHKRIGFKEVGRYTSPAQTEWSIVIWDWK